MKGSFRFDASQDLLDRSLGKKVIAGPLRKAGAIVEIHDDHFSHDAASTEFPSQMGTYGSMVEPTSILRALPNGRGSDQNQFFARSDGRGSAVSWIRP